MKKYLTIFIFFLMVFGCSSPIKVIKLQVKENELYIQNRKVIIDDFESEIIRLTNGLSKEELEEVTFSLTMDGKSKVGIVSDLKRKIESWKDSVRKE
ncbi:hypothetical protein [Ulvibacterium marinum]|uniref:hypothetical protein n=1 Tax=Ulvibacterium marinum TaxID=2419782 RepID=UPI00249407CE|nr:hypothetical protein [Ulvibacterium marinum]